MQYLNENNNIKKLVLISHYNSNIDWLEKLQVPYVVYSKSLRNNNFIDFNKGQEVPMYLKFIIDWYDKLPDKILFYHDHLHSPHQDFDSVFIINNVNWELDEFFSVNKREWYHTIQENCPIEPMGINWVNDNWDIFNKHLTKQDRYSFYCGAQFVIDKKLILNYEKSFYESLYEWIKTSNLSNYITSRIFEYTWHYIFTKNPIEKKYKIEDVFIS